MINARLSTLARFVGNTISLVTDPIGRKSNAFLKAPNMQLYLPNLSPIMGSSWCNMTPLPKEGIPTMISSKPLRPMC